MIKKIISVALALAILVWGFAIPAAAAALTAAPTSSIVLLNGENVAFNAYNIEGNNYFKLRDLAYALNGTEKQFEVGWDGANDAISLTSGKPYTADGSEMKGKGSGSKTPSPTSAKITLDGGEVQFTAYNIEGNNYFKLRDIGQALDFGVGWDSANDTIVIDTSKGYGDDASWKRSYMEEILASQEYAANFDWSDSGDYDSRYPRYITDIKLADLNFDGIPELLICGESIFASSYVGIYAMTANGAQRIFHELIESGPTLYRNPENGGLVYGFICLNISPDDYSEYFYTVYMTGEESTLAFDGQNVGEDEYDSLFAGFIALPGYPASIKDIYPDDYKDNDYVYSEDEILRFFDLYSPEPAGGGIGAGIEYSAVIGFYRDFANSGEDKDEAIESFLADISGELGIIGERQLYELENSLFELFDGEAGYAIHDINGDGIPELIILSKDYYDVCAIYTLRGGNPVLVGAYWSRNRCEIDKNGTIYISGSSGASDSFFAAYWLCAENGELELLEEFGDGSAYSDNPTKDAGLVFIDLKK